MRLPRRSVSRNVSRKLPFIAVPGDHHCRPLQIAATFTGVAGGKLYKHYVRHVEMGISASLGYER